MSCFGRRPVGPACRPAWLVAVAALMLPPVGAGSGSGRARAEEAAGPRPARAEAPVGSEPVFNALLTDGTTASGRIRRLDAGGTVVLVGDQERSIPVADLVKLTCEPLSPPIPPEGMLVILPGGDRLRANITKSDQEALEVDSNKLGHLRIPLECLLGLVLAPPAASADLEALLEQVRDAPRTSETLWLANGDRRVGGYVGLNDRSVAFRPKGKDDPVEVDRLQVLAVGFDPSLVAYPRPEGSYFELTLADGSRLGASDLRIEKGQVAATARFGAPLQLALGSLARLHVRGERVAYLSEREADAAEYEPYVGPTRRYRRDEAVDGSVLRLGGQAYDRGLGTQSRTLLAYRLRPGDRRFQALVGLDDRAGPYGNVVFRVRVDGKDRFVSPPMAAREAPRAIDVDVTGGKVLILVTEFGDRGSVRDFADWVEARLIR